MQTADANQVRESGDPMFLIRLLWQRFLNIEMDSSLPDTGLLHDVVEDCGIPLSEIERSSVQRSYNG